MELTQERLEELRSNWKILVDPVEKEKVSREGKLISAYLKNNKWGSIEVGGNGYCTECRNSLARVGHYNCLGCAQEKKVNYQARTIAGIQQGLLEMSKSVSLNIKDPTLSNALEIFEVR